MRTGASSCARFSSTKPLQVDGKLDDEVYRSVPPIAAHPGGSGHGEPSTEKTEAWVMFDENYIYVSARCYESVPPDKWTANELRRDTNQLRQNDTFGVLIDTFHDRRNGYNFYTNPLGGFADQVVTDEGNPNTDWNPVWEVRTGRFDGGWTVGDGDPVQVDPLQLGREPGVGHPAAARRSAARTSGRT